MAQTMLEPGAHDRDSSRRGVGQLNRISSAKVVEEPEGLALGLGPGLNPTFGGVGSIP
jgi:hypothetical protein